MEPAFQQYPYSMSKILLRMLPLVLLMSCRFHENTKNIRNDGNSLPNDGAMPPGNMDLQYRELLNVGTGVRSEL